MVDAYRKLEELAGKHRLAPRYLREIVYLQGLGYRHKHIREKTGYAESTITKYRRKLREMPEEDAAEILRLVAEVKKPETAEPAAEG